MAFTDLIKEQRKSGMGVSASLSSAAKMTIKEKLDVRNYLFKKDSLMTALFPGLKGYKAELKNSKAGLEKNQDTSNKVDSQILKRLDVIGKNTLALPVMMRDMNVMRQGIIKLVKLQGAELKNKADMYFQQAAERERLYEALFGKESEKKDKEKAKEEKQAEKSPGLFSQILSGLSTLFLGKSGLLSLFGSLATLLTGPVGLVALFGTAAVALTEFTRSSRDKAAREGDLRSLDATANAGIRFEAGGEYGHGSPGGSVMEQLENERNVLLKQNTPESKKALNVVNARIQKYKAGEQKNELMSDRPWFGSESKKKWDEKHKKQIEELDKQINEAKTVMESDGELAIKDNKLTRDWAYSVFVGMNTMAQVPANLKEDVQKILDNPPKNWKAPVQEAPVQESIPQQATEPVVPAGPAAVGGSPRSKFNPNKGTGAAVAGTGTTVGTPGPTAPVIIPQEQVSVSTPSGPAAVGGPPRSKFNPNKGTGAAVAETGTTVGTPGPTAPEYIPEGAIDVGEPTPVTENKGFVETGIEVIKKAFRGDYGVSTWGLDTTTPKPTQPEVSQEKKASKEPKPTPTKPTKITNKQLLDMIASGEAVSSDPYNSMNQGTPKGAKGIHGSGVSSAIIGKKLTDMTVGEILRSAPKDGDDAATRTRKKSIFAAGRYQIVPKTLRMLVDSKSVGLNEKFTNDLQDRLAIKLMERRNVFDHIAKGKMDDAQYELSKEWASLPVPAGKKLGSGKISTGVESYYGGANKAKSSLTVESLMNKGSGLVPNPQQKNGVVPGAVISQVSNENAVSQSSTPPVVIDNTKVVNQAGGGQQGSTRQGQNSKNVANAYDAELFGSMMMRTIL